MTSDVAVVLMVYKSRRVLVPFLESIGARIPIILVDNSFQEDDLADVLSGYPNVTHLDSGGNIGFSAAANLGARHATAPYLVFMNPDTRPTESALRELVTYLRQNPDVGACGATGLGTAGGGAQPTTRRVVAHVLGLHRHDPLAGIYYQDIDASAVEVEWVAGSCMAVRRAVFATVGGFDPSYFIYMSDFDLGLRIKAAGYRQVVLGDVAIRHDDGGSSELPQLLTWERRGRAWARFLRRTRPLPAALGLSLLLATGYVMRAVMYSMRRQRTRSREVLTYAWSVVDEWVRPNRSVA
jgi:GT2 family glycosyltransferase